MNPNIISNHFAHLFSFYVLFSEWGSQWFFPLFFKCMHLYTREQIEIWKKKQRSLEPTLGKENIQADSEV